MSEVSKLRFTCFVAERDSPSSSFALQARPAITADAPFLEKVSDQILLSALNAIEMPEARDRWGVPHATRGIVGAVVFDTLGQHIPMQRVVIGGLGQWQRRSDVGYISNLCVSRDAQRSATRIIPLFSAG